MIPTSIDGTDITGATIDGTDVQEITVDGDVVFSAGPTGPVPVAYSNLIAWYPFDSAEYGGSNADDVTAILGGSGDDTAYDGTVNGATYQSSGGVTDITAGANSGAFDFNGDAITLGNPSAFQFDANDSFSICCWVESDGGDSQFVSIRDIGVAPWINFQADPTIKARISANGFIDADSGIFPGSTYFHAAFTYSSNTISIYVDGNFEGSDTDSMSGNFTRSSDNWQIGNHLVNNSTSHDGRIDDVRFYDKELTNSEVNQIYTNTQP